MAQCTPSLNTLKHTCTCMHNRARCRPRWRPTTARPWTTFDSRARRRVGAGGRLTTWPPSSRPFNSLRPRCKCRVGEEEWGEGSIGVLLKLVDWGLGVVE